MTTFKPTWSMERSERDEEELGEGNVEPGQEVRITEVKAGQTRLHAPGDLEIEARKTGDPVGG